MATLISGNPGSGKSTLTTELVRRGIRAVDSDEVIGLAAWMNARGETIGDASLAPTPELLSSCYWGWSASRLDELLEHLGPDGVLLGVAANLWDFVHRFESLVLLELDDATQRERVASRDPLFQQQIRAGLPVLQARMIEHGARRISGAQPPAIVADQVLAVLARS